MRTIFLCLFCLLLMIALAHATCPTGTTCIEISQFPTNIGIGTFDTSNNLNLAQGGLAIGDHSYTGIATAPYGLNVKGNVGIGTFAPMNNLDMGGGGINAGNMTLTALPTGCVQSTNGVLSSTGSYCGSGGGGGGSPGGIQGDIQFLDVQGTLLGFGGNTGFTYTGTGSTPGNVGVDSTNPGQVVDVQGTVRALFFQGNGSLLTNVGNGTVNTGTVNQAAYYASSTNAVSGTNDLIFKGLNIGISSANPGQMLDVQGTVRAVNFLGNGSLLSGLPGGTPGGSSSQVQYNSAGAFTANAGFVYNGTNVGLGSTNPGQMLDVQGTVRTIDFQGAGQILSVQGTLAPFTNMGLIDVQGTQQSFTVSANGTVQTNGTGNIGINSTAPGELLDILGTARANNFWYNNCAAHAGQAQCIGTNGAGGYCTSVVGAGGACTCVNC